MTENRKTIIRIFEQVGGNAAVSSEDGDNLYKLIDKAFEGNSKVVLDFQNIELVITPFLNASIGQLYNKYDSVYLNSNLEIINLSPDDLAIMRKVIQRAKEYFLNKGQMDAFINDTLGDDH